MAATRVARAAWLVRVLGAFLVLSATSSAVQGREPGLRIKAMQYGFGQKSWTATLTDDRRMTVQVAGESRVFTVSPSQLRTLRKAVEQERFDLADSYGQQETDVDFRTLEVAADGRTKTVIVYATLGREQRIDEVKRALRVAIATRSLFDWPAALDTREEDEKLLRSLSQ